MLSVPCFKTNFIYKTKKKSIFFEVSSRDELIKMTKVISLDNVVFPQVYIYANAGQLYTYYMALMDQFCQGQF